MASQKIYATRKTFESQNFIWSNKDQLGSGAGGTVYVGYSKNSGEKVAVKEFKQSNYLTVHQQEIEVLRCLPSHKNIVKLFSAESELMKHNPVLVMELCTGRSLYEVIESPENAFGLCEDEFKTVMIDITEGLAHLRRHNVIHRDIKPGNIMRCRNEDGSYSYKLTDFGAARELADGDRFVSLYGTEEYLHPDVYEKALVNTDKKTQFTAKVDLWSIGATLYHAATGRLPFQSFSPRKDRQTMFQIISKKERKVISGVQGTHQGPVEWNKHLPEDTRISKGLKLLLEPILQGVLETDVNYMMDFDHFFEQVKSIGRMKVFDVFVVSKCECLKVYIRRGDSRPYSTLKRSVCEQSRKLDELYMDLFFDNLPVLVQDQTSVDKMPQTTEDRPIFVYGGQVEDHLKAIPLKPVPKQPDAKELKASMQFAKECKKLIFYHKHVTTMLNRKFTMMHQSALCMSHVLRKDQELMDRLYQSVATAHSSVKNQLYNFIGSLWQLRELLISVNTQVQGALTDFIKSIADEKQRKRIQLEQLEEKHEPINMKVLSMLETMKRDKPEEWDPNYLSECFLRSMDTVNHQCTQASEEVDAITGLARSVSSSSPSNPICSYEMKVLSFTKNHLHTRLTKSRAKLTELTEALTALHRRLHNWLNATVVTHNETVAMQKALDKERRRYSEESERLTQWMTDSDKRLKEMAQQIAVVFQNHVDGIQRQASSQVTSRTPNTPLSQIQRDEITHMLQLVDKMTTSLNISMDSVREGTAEMERRTSTILREVNSS